MRTKLFAPLAFALILGCTPSAPSPTPAAPTSATAEATSSPAPAAGRATDTFATAKGDVKVTPIFHASTLLEVGGQAIYVDPFSKGDFTGLPKADFILITDVHQDHLDPKAIDAIAKPTTRIVAPKAAAEGLKGRANVTPLDNGQKQSLGLFEVEAVPMYNWERGPQPGKLFHDKGRGNGYVVTFGDKRFYFSGDTECIPEMKALASIDVAFVCMNLPYTMPPQEAAACINAFKPKVLFPYHYAAPGGASSNLDELKSALDPKAGVEVRLRRWY
jgi:L-ascorbate metabolism protein UlaG (beta-lactamase superfamily)